MTSAVGFNSRFSCTFILCPLLPCLTLPAKKKANTFDEKNTSAKFLQTFAASRFPSVASNLTSEYSKSRHFPVSCCWKPHQAGRFHCGGASCRSQQRSRQATGSLASSSPVLPSWRCRKKGHKSGEDSHSRTNQVRLTPPAVEPSPSPAWARELLNQQSSMRLRKCKGVNALSFFAEIASNTAALPAIKVLLPYAEEDATELGWDRSVTSSAEEDKRTQH